MDLSKVTLACIDCVDPRLGAAALIKSVERLPFAHVMLFSHACPQNLPEAFRFVPIDRMRDVDSYNRFVLRQLHKHVQTDYVLTIQTDGYVIHPELWDQDWLGFDYIGSPWKPGARYAQKSRNGNSGICLRSKRILERTAQLATDEALQKHRDQWRRILDDVFTCYDLHDQLVAEGFRFAPASVAGRFGFERSTPEAHDADMAFGFHGRRTVKTKAYCNAIHPTRNPSVQPNSASPYRNPNVKYKLPERGLISPANQKIIQLDVTNACPKRCSNCTRFVMHNRKPYVMDRPTFEKALESMEGFGGMLGVMGGEPTIHPDFEWITRHFRANWDAGRLYPHGRDPIADFGQHRTQHLGSLHHRRGLWTSLGKRYYDHYELIQETYGYQCINDHSHPGLHQALLVSWKDLGLTREQFEEKRDRCWVQRLWSASITPHGAYFCEVAGAIDNLFYQGKHAWPVEKNWWKREQADFGEQLKLCDHCSACLDVPRRPATDETEDVSPSNHQRLVQLQSPAIRKQKVAVFAPEVYDPAKHKCDANPEWYMEQPSGRIENEKRIEPTNRSIYPRQLDGLTVCVGYAEALAKTLPHNRPLCSEYVVVTTSRDAETQQVARDNGATLVVSDRCYDGGAGFNKGRLLNDGLAKLDAKDWLILHDADVLLPPSLWGWMSGHVLNPGCLYWTHRSHAETEEHVRAIRADWSYVQKLRHHYEGGDKAPWGFFHLVNVRAQALRKQPYMHEGFPAACSVDVNFLMRWPEAKQICIHRADKSMDAVHVYHGEPAKNWCGVDPELRKRVWKVLSVTFGNDPWLRRPIELPCHVKMMNVRTGEEITRAVRTEADKPVIRRRSGITEFGWPGYGFWAQDGRQVALWNHRPCERTQFDLYSIPELPKD